MMLLRVKQQFPPAQLSIFNQTNNPNSNFTTNSNYLTTNSNSISTSSSLIIMVSINSNFLNNNNNCNNNNNRKQANQDRLYKEEESLPLYLTNLEMPWDQMPT